MAANQVEIAQLRVMADYFVNAEYPYFEELREAFKLLRVTGCRIQEIFEIERWTFVSGYTVNLQPQKFNNERTIILTSEFSLFIAAVQGQYKPFLGRTYSQLQYLFSKINPYGKLYSSTKEITNYFFRYLFVRELDFAGLTIEQIADVMGYTSTTAVHNYLDAVLTSTIEVPVQSGFIFDGLEYPIVTIGNQKWTARNLIFNDFRAGIRYPANNILNVENYGCLYSPEVCIQLQSSIPAGWRIPTNTDIQNLINYLNVNTLNTYALRATGLDFWNNSLGTDFLNFNARGAGWYSSSFLLFKSAFMIFSIINPSTSLFMRSFILSSRNYITSFSFTGYQPYGLSLRFVADL